MNRHLIQENLIDSDESRPFIETARRKGISLLFDRAFAQDQVAIWRLDMELVRISLENAILRAQKLESVAILERLQHLLSSGAPAQQVQFVLGTSAVYYFPEDIEKMVASGPQIGHRFSVQRFSWLRCRPLDDGSHAFEEHNNQICLILGPSKAVAVDPESTEKEVVA